MSKCMQVSCFWDGITFGPVLIVVKTKKKILIKSSRINKKINYRICWLNKIQKNEILFSVYFNNFFCSSLSYELLLVEMIQRRFISNRTFEISRHHVHCTSRSPKYLPLAVGQMCLTSLGLIHNNSS